MFHPQLIYAAVTLASGFFPPLQVINSLSTGTQAIGMGVSTIGGLGGLYMGWKHASDMNGILHKTLEVVSLGSLCCGIGTLFTMIPGAQGALL